MIGTGDVSKSLRLTDIRLVSTLPHGRPPKSVSSQDDTPLAAEDGEKTETVMTRTKD